MIDYRASATARADTAVGSAAAPKRGTHQVPASAMPPVTSELTASAAPTELAGSAGPALALESTRSAGSAVVAELDGAVEWLRYLPVAADDAERIDRIAALERLRGAVAAAQARETVEFAASQLASQAAAGVPESRRGRGIAEQVGLARRMSPASAARQITLAEALHWDLPAVGDALRQGETSEWTATLIARETNGLDRHTRRRIADELAPDLPDWSPRQVEAAARRMAYEADPEAVMARGRTARADRRVGLRPAPDTMSTLSAFLPAEQGVAAWASLDRHARTMRATGDRRTLGQLMADTLVERVTGQVTATAVPIEISLTMTADSLLGTDQTPAELDGYGPIPADLALDLAAQASTPTPSSRPSSGSAPTVRSTPTASPAPPPSFAVGGVAEEDVAVAVWVRRLFTDPVDDTVVHVDTRRRRFDGRLARLVRHRDRVCRDPFCTAPIRHLDHVEPYRDGGPTTAMNGAGLCERGNYAKDVPGWVRRVVSEAGSNQVIEIRTPTGHRYTSKPPPALGPGADYRERSRRIARRRIAYLERERLIASLPSPSTSPAADPRPSEPP